ncbi:MAG: hypothetical protein GYA17_03335 [Chloroflexi bacterium]|nr:hypothetical protein [Chloroflexota bacterium]
MADPLRINSSQSSANSLSGNQAAASPSDVNGANFADTLAGVQDLKFSNHAQKRLQSRNITLDDDGIARLSTAIDKAEKRGGRESLVLVDDLAFIVNVQNRMVITALDAQSRGEGVFTQIDSVVFADPSSPEQSGSSLSSRDVQA